MEADPERAGDAPTASGSRARGCAVELAQTLIVTALLFLGIQGFIVQPFKVEQVSMQHSFEAGDYVLVDKLTPRWDAYSRGDVVVFTPPADADRGTTPFIKRVIGLPGDRLEIDGGRVVVNGVTLDEPYLYAGADGQPEPTLTSRQQQWVVPRGELFVMGDHRQESIDSRRFGTIEIASVLGRAVLRYWPPVAAGVVHVPAYEGVPAP